MKRCLSIIACQGLLLAVSCHKGPQRIPRGDMEDIMYQVLLQDQYVKQQTENRRQYDTTLVYEGIFQSFGYDTDDFRTSLEYYLEDPSRMAKIMEAVEDRLVVQVKILEKEVEEQTWRDHYMRIWNLRPETTRLPQPVSADTLFVQFDKDSLAYHPHTKKK